MTGVQTCALPILEYGVITKNGNSYSFGDIKLGVGRENARKAIKRDSKLMREIKKAVLAKIHSSNIEDNN